MASKFSLMQFLLLANLGTGTAALDEETPAHCEHTLEFMTTCLIVNESPQFVHVLGMVFDLVNHFFRAMRLKRGTRLSALLKRSGNRELQKTAGG